ncbi:MAG TPA: RHS repeat-associated core domain-containing protein, partial [Candidatus Dojkabacteria bacterium]|nr:RHS repeat-associated core domain-containing protein [Candidatus Dojkabacteria bacterium]
SESATKYTSKTAGRLYYYEARYYDPRTVIFYGVDQMADKYPSWSPYTYTLDNPIRYIDEKGKNPLAIIGAVVGASKEIFSQTISNGKKNLDAGNGFFHGWARQMDWADVGISTVSGAIAGLTGGGSLLLTEAPESILKSAVDWKGGDPTPNVVFGSDKYKKSISEASIDLANEAVGVIFGKASGLNELISGNKSNFVNSSILSGVKGFFGGLLGIARDEVKGEIKSTIVPLPLIVDKVIIEDL